jgi:glycerate 2-kinase
VTPERSDAAATLVAEYAARARALAPGHAVVVPCEPSLRVVAHHGRGGRCGWLALALLAHLPPDVAFLAGASDGVDGTSGSSGACVAGDVPFDAPAVAAALAAFDDAPMHASLGTALPGGPTGTNLTDVHVLARAR